MKSPLLYFVAASAVLAGVGGTLHAESAISIRVEQDTKSDMNPKDILKREHARTVNVFVTNNSGDPAELKVKHIVFGRDLVHHDLVTVGEGENAATVKPHTTEKVGTTEAKVIASEKHWDAKTKKIIEASGATIVGVGVQVLQGSTLVAEFYDPTSLKEKWGKTIPLTGLKTPAAKPAVKPPAKPAVPPAAAPAKK